MSIFIKTKHIDERYQYLIKYALVMWKSFWTPAKYQKNIENLDAPYVLNVMSDSASLVVKRCVLAISLVEDKVKTFWSYLVSEIPQTIIGEIGAVFGNSEAVHSQSYRALAESLGLQKDFEDIMKYPVMRGRANYLQKYLQQDPRFRGKKRVLKKLILFTSLVERASLFSQFYILMSFAFRNKGLKTISSLQSSTASEELVHYKFGIELINIIKSENPKLWDDTLERLIKKDIGEAYKNEIKLVDWIFEEGIPDHLTREEVVNFISYNFSIIANDLGLPLKFTFDEKLYEERNSWFMTILKPAEPDFFVVPVGGYSSVEEDILEEELEDIFN